MRKANKKEIRKLKRESARREIDRLVDSLDFEPVNFNEKVCQLRRLMCLPMRLYRQVDYQADVL